MISPSPASIPLIPIQIFSAGNLVTAGLQLYRQHFKLYFRLSAIAHLWLLLLLVCLGLIFLPANLFVFELPSSFNPVLRLVCLGLLLLSWAKYQSLSAAIVRLAFYHLLNTTETPATARRYTNSRLWGFWLISFLTLLVFMLVAIGLYILLSLAFGMVAFVVGGTAVLQNPQSATDSGFFTTLAVTFGILMLVAGIPALLFFLWIVARLFLAEVAYAIEPEVKAIKSIDRSWKLTGRNGLRVGLVFTLILTVLFPLQFAYQVVNTLLQGALIWVSPTQASSLFLVSLVVSYGLSLVFNSIMLPAWQVTKAILYYDLRSRREGAGLVLEEDRTDTRRPIVNPLIPTLLRRTKILTPESVELEFTLAGIGNRAQAMLIDYSIVLLGLLLFSVLWSTFSYQLLSYLDSLGTSYRSVPLWLLAVGILVSFVFVTGYFVGFETLRQGQTPGKRFTKIRVIRDDGRPVGLAQAVLRSLLQLLDYFLFIGAFMIFWGRQEKRIGDWAAGTLVIQENRAVKQAIVLSDRAKQLAVELPQQTDLEQLQPQHFALIGEYLQRRGLMDIHSRSDRSLEMARQVRTIIHLETIPEDLTGEQFLEAVYLAYQTHDPDASSASNLGFSGA